MFSVLFFRRSFDFIHSPIWPRISRFIAMYNVDNRILIRIYTHKLNEKKKNKQYVFLP